MPIALDLLPSFWKSLREEHLDLRDLQEADCITYNLTQKMLDVRMCVGVFGTVFHRALSKRATYDVIKHFCVASTKCVQARVCPSPSTERVAVAAANKFVDLYVARSLVPRLFPPPAFDHLQMQTWSQVEDRHTGVVPDHSNSRVSYQPFSASWC